MNWNEHPEVKDYINRSWTVLKDWQLCEEIYKQFAVKISDPETIRNLRRKEGWIKVTTNNQSSANKFEKVLFIGDFHIPDHDKKLVELLIKFIKYFKPDKIYLIGDLIDCYPVSKFYKSVDRMGDLQKELDIAQNIIDKIFKLCKDITFLEGNHEHRIVTYLEANPALFGLDCLKIESLLGLDKRGIKSYGYKHEPIEHHKFQIHHGNIFRKYSGWSAKGLWEKYGGCGIAGHSHRGGNFIKRTRQGIFAWYENMCLCKKEASYGDFFDWHQGWSIAYFTKKDLFHLEQIPVVKHQFLFQGKMFTI